MSVQYQRFLKVLEKWPVDKNKVGRDLCLSFAVHLIRKKNMSSKYAYQLEQLIFSADQEDLGEQIRKQIKTLADPVGLNQESTESITKQIDSLERLANNTYGRKYQRVFTSTATGLTAEQCNQVLSSEFLQYLKDNKKYFS